MIKQPLNSLVIALGLNDPHFNNNYESSEILIYIVGTLSYLYDLHTVDSFLHPLFMKHIFTENQLLQNKNSEQDSFIKFTERIISRGGVFKDNYEEMNVKSLRNTNSLNNFQNNGNNGTRWLCLVMYRLVHDGPWLQHARQGRSKKIARMRVICDIYNYYKRNGALLITHCSSQLIHNHDNNNNSIINGDDIHPAEKLNIPIEHRYQYDDDDFVEDTIKHNSSNNEWNNDNNSNQISIPKIKSNQLGKRYRKYPDTLPILSHPINNDGGDGDFLVQTLLGDFSNMTCEETLKIHPSTTLTYSKPFDQNNTTHFNHNQYNYNKNDNLIISSLPPSTSTLSIFDSSDANNTHDDDNYDDKHKHKHKKICLFQSSKSDNNNNTMHHSQQNNRLNSNNIMLPTPGLQLQQNQLHPQHEINKVKENLIRQAQLCLQHLSMKEKKRLLIHSEYLKTRPHEAKCYLSNLSNKLNGGHFDIKVTPLTFSSSIYSAKATFGATNSLIYGDDEFEIQVIYNSSKKKTAEGIAAYSIVDLLKNQLISNV
ncbi:unnamed protein product [Cunninghamella blakesleeana]